MIVRTAWSRILLTAALSTTTLACTGDDTPAEVDIDEVEPIESPERLVATIGPAGGELAGPAGTPWEGVHLVMPAGALAADTEIAIEAIVDPTPLVAPAERIGPQFRLLPDHLVLAKPAVLTVPYDHSLRAGFETPDSECRVWYRSGDGWMNAPQTASTSETVTVEISQLTTVAAGVFATPVKTSCTGCMPLPECLAGSGFCISQLATPTATMFDLPSLVVENGVMYYVTSPSTNTFTIATYDTKTTPPTQRTFVALSATPNAAVKARGLVVEAPTIVSVGLGGYGNVRFRTDAPPSRTETAANMFPFGYVIDPILDEPLRMFGQNITFESIPGVPSTRTTVERVRWMRGADGQNTSPVTFTTLKASASLFAVRRNLPAYIPAGTAGHVQYFTFHASDASVGTFSPGTSTDDRTLEAPLTSLAVSEGRQYAWAGNIDTGSSNLVRVDPTTDEFDSEFYELPFLATSMAFDDQNNVYAINSLRPELYIVAPDGGISSLLLTDQPEGSAEYAARTPRAIRYVKESDSLILVTGGTSASSRRIFRLTNLPD